MVKQAPTTVSIRPAIDEDCRRLWEWRNEPATRESSFDVRYISYEDHQTWFARSLDAPDRRIFIITDDSGREMGYVRFNVHRQEAEISVSLDKAKRGRGLGSTAIKMASDYMLADNGVEMVFAYVKLDNAGSLSAFQRAGFTLEGVADVAGTDAYKLVYQGTSLA